MYSKKILILLASYLLFSCKNSDLKKVDVDSICSVKINRVATIIDSIKKYR